MFFKTLASWDTSGSFNRIGWKIFPENENFKLLKMVKKCIKIILRTQTIPLKSFWMFSAPFCVVKSKYLEMRNSKGHSASQGTLFEPFDCLYFWVESNKNPRIKCMIWDGTEQSKFLCLEYLMNYKLPCLCSHWPPSNSFQCFQTGLGRLSLSGSFESQKMMTGFTL